MIYISKLIYLSVGSVIDANAPIIRKKKKKKIINTTPVNFHERKRYLFQRRRIVSKVVVSTNVGQA